MFEDQPTILSSDSSSNYPPDSSSDDKKRLIKKIITVGLIAVVSLAVVVGLVYLITKFFPLINKPAPTPTGTTTVPTLSPTLPTQDPVIVSKSTTTFSNLAIEYLSFSDFYVPPDNKSVEAKFSDYQLPLNVKLDVLNYYDISRKINLDSGLDSLNNNGFALYDNPWSKEAPDFYKIFGKLEEKQIPFFISSDFIIYYYQTILKKSFKDIEKNIFYDNLWALNKELYTLAKNRYEARLAAIGNVNDSVLEGERLEMAYFAVALELLKPMPEQIILKGALDDQTKFIAVEAERFYFVVPPYLRDDVVQEVKLIKAASKQKTKSPVLLYDRDYSEFTVPTDYQANAKLNNFYLTTKWLNSNFPINYRTADCPGCLLDKEDWRVSVIAANFISQDFASLPDLKNRWARIYKVIGFFKGLREDLNYVHYRDSLIALFGQNYQVEQLFDDKNAEAWDNLEKFRTKILTYDFPAIQGAYDKTSLENQSKLGFKMLAESYWPNGYVFDYFVSPPLGNFLGDKPALNNVTYCGKENKRCSGFSLDVVNLVTPIIGNSFFDENTNYVGYGDEVSKLQTQLNKNTVWHTTNYWTNLDAIRSLLSVDRGKLPIFYRSEAWQDRVLKTAAATWINFQLPLEKFSFNQLFKGNGLNFSRWSENSYVEPNLNLINELLANNNMLLKMFSTLQLDQEAKEASINLQNASNNLSALKGIILKELEGTALTPEDNQVITDFAKQLTVTALADKERQIIVKGSKQKNGFLEDLGRLKIMVLVHQEGENKVFSVGPVWGYQKSR